MSDAVARLNTALEGRYTIERELGEGGMATVYLAHDIKHERKVALKVLKPELAAVVGAERFLGEIKTTANLQHPHILPLFDSGEADGFLFYVMPYVEGETLRDRIDREKQLPVDEAVRITMGVANALDYAHRHNVIHRDIKPANILLQDGEPVVADFGIALAVGAAGSNRLTETGLSLGTPYYMSPEQATGDQVVGSSTDTYALGSVLYEMLTGEPPFPGSTAQAVLGKIIAGEPVSAAKYRPSVPANVDAAVRRALEKLPADRFTSAQEFVRALGDEHFRYGEAGVGAGGVRVGVVTGPWNRISVTLAGATLLLAAAFGWALLRPPPPGPVVRSALTFSEGQEPEPGAALYLVNLTLSPDGSMFVYQGPSELFLRRLTSLEAERIPGTEGGESPVISPEGASLAFIAQGDLKTVPLQGGGAPRTVMASAVRPADGGGIDWSSDGMLYFTDLEGALWRVPASAGEPESVTTADPGTRHAWVDALPEGQGLLFTIARADPRSNEIAVLGFEEGEVRTLFPGVLARYADSGHIIYVSADGTLLSAPFDVRKLEVTGESIALLEGLFRFGRGHPQFALSETGTLLYQVAPESLGGVPIWVERDGTSRPIDPLWTGTYSFPAISPDGTQLAVDSANGTGNIWVKQLDDGALTKLTFEGATNFRPSWSPDGRSVLFSSNRDGVAQYDNDIYSKPAGAGADVVPDLVLDRPRGVVDAFWSPDGEWLVYRTTNIVEGAGDILAIRPGVDTVPVPLAATEFTEQSPTLSPDGRWLAYESNESGRFQIYVIPFPNIGDERRSPISTAGGRWPVWANSGRELFYVSLADELVAVDVQTTPTFARGAQDVLFSTSRFNLYSSVTAHPMYDISFDDQRFVMVQGAGTVTDEPEFILVQNFFEVVREQVGN